MKTKVWSQPFGSYSGYSNIFVKRPGELAKLVAYHVKESNLKQSLEYWKNFYKAE